MSELKHISVVAVGNPDGNGGVGEIAMYNSPQFNVRHDIHPGLGDNSYYFSVKIENNYTVYKLIKNNVRSKGAFRDGYLAIAFSIPRGYALVATTPYQVLMELWKVFKNTCMTLKDPQLDVYEYSSKQVDTKVFDETATAYSLNPVKRRYLPMNSRGEVAIVQQSEDKIEQLLADVQYEEFSPFSEILIAESVGSTSKFTLLTNIQIPRPVAYTVFVDRNAAGVANDRNAAITVRSNANPHYFDNVEKSFTIAELLEGADIPGITVDEEKEQIVVSTVSWPKAKKKKIQIRIEPTEAEVYFKKNSDLLQVTKNNVLCVLDDDFCFELTGQEIALFEDKNIELKIRKNNGYVLDKLVFGKDELKVLAKQYEKVIPTHPRSRVSKPTESKPSEMSAADEPSKCLDVKILLTNAFFYEGKKVMEVKCVRTTPNGQETIQQTLVYFQHNEQRNYEGHLYLSRIWSDTSVILSFEHGNKKYVTNGRIDFQKNVLLLQQKDFRVVTAGNNSKYSLSKIIILLASFILGVGLGLAIGYGIGSSSDEPAEQEQNDETPPVNEVGQDGASTQGAFVKKGFIKRADSLLNKKDVSFAQIHQLFEDWKKMHIDADDQVSKKIRAYDRLVTFIERGDIESAQNPENLRMISRYHAVQVKKLGENNWKDANGNPITGFDKIKEEVSPTAESEKAAQTNHSGNSKDKTKDKSKEEPKKSEKAR